MKPVLLSLILFWVIETAAQGAEMKFGGEFRVRGFYTNNLSDARNGGKGACRGPDGISGNANDTCNDQEAFNDARFRLKVMATEGLATGVVLIDFFNGFSGRNVATLNSDATGAGTGDRTLGSEGFGRSLDSVRLKEGYLRLSWPGAHLIVGRQGMTMGHGLILDDTADAISLAIPIGWASLTFVDLLLDTDSSGSNTSAYLSNLSLFPSAHFGSSLFVLYLRDRGPNLILTPCETGGTTGCAISAFGADHTGLSVFGWAMDYQRPSLRWATEVDYLKGTIRTDQKTVRNPLGRGIDLHGVNLLGQVGWSRDRLETGLTGLYATGQEAGDLPKNEGHQLNINAVSPNFVLGNILVNNETVSDRDGGSMGGLTAARLSIGWRPTATFRGELAWIRAWLTERPDPGASRDLGWELDANAFYQLDSKLLLTGGFGLLFTNDAWKALMEDAEATDRMIKLSTKLSYTF